MNTPEVSKVSKGVKSSFDTGTVKSVTPFRGTLTVTPPFGSRWVSEVPRPEQPGFILELRTTPGRWQAVPEQRLRGLLKLALRAFGFRGEVCRLAGTVEPGKQPGAAKPPHTEAEKLPL